MPIYYFFLATQMYLQYLPPTFACESHLGDPAVGQRRFRGRSQALRKLYSLCRTSRAIVPRPASAAPNLRDEKS